MYNRSSYHLILKVSLVHRQVCMSEDDLHVRDGHDSHENADFIYQAVNQGGGPVLIRISLSSLPDIRPGSIHLVVSLLAAPSGNLA